MAFIVVYFWLLCSLFMRESSNKYYILCMFHTFVPMDLFLESEVSAYKFITLSFDESTMFVDRLDIIK